MPRLVAAELEVRAAALERRKPPPRVSSPNAGCRMRSCWHAREQHNVEAAERLVRVLEMTHRRGREMATLVDAYERLWKLQHTSICDC